MGGIAIVCAEPKGASTAYEGVVPPPVMVQRFGQTAIQYSRGRMSAPRISEEAQADVKLPGAERRREGIEIDQDRGFFSTEAQFRGMPLCVQLNQKVNDSVGPPRGSTVINSPEGHDLGGPSGASSGDHPRTFDGPGDRDRRLGTGLSGLAFARDRP